MLMAWACVVLGGNLLTPYGFSMDGRFLLLSFWRPHLSNTELCLNFVIEENMDMQSLQCDKCSVSINVDSKCKDMTLPRA